MAHALHIENGKASMMYVDDPPWHRLGTQLKESATAAVAIKAANLDWTVVKRSLLAFDGKVSHPIPDRFAIVREDWYGQPKPIFGIVGSEYTPLQNRDAFSFFDDIVGQGAAIYHTAGALGEGERVWILAKLPEEMRVLGEDIAHKYLLLANSHDGSSAVQIKFTPIRVVCQNTLSMALAEGRTLRVPHLRNLRDRMEQATEVLGIIRRRYQAIELKFRAMAQVKLSDQQVQQYLEQVWPNPPREPEEPRDRRYDEALAKARANRAWAEHFCHSGTGVEIKGVRGTLWAAYNGVAELVDHRQATQRGGQGSLFGNGQDAAEDRRLQSIWFGEGYSAKVRAYRAACEWIGRARTA
jgi:phage/plasmid-like protein (TIGR03299 family)